VTLVNQKFIRDPESKQTVKTRIAEAAKAAGADVKPVSFVRFVLGAED